MAPRGHRRAREGICWGETWSGLQRGQEADSQTGIRLGQELRIFLGILKWKRSKGGARRKERRWREVRSGRTVLSLCPRSHEHLPCASPLLEVVPECSPLQIQGVRGSLGPGPDVQPSLQNALLLHAGIEVLAKSHSHRRRRRHRPSGRASRKASQPKKGKIGEVAGGGTCLES